MIASIVALAFWLGVIYVIVKVMLSYWKQFQNEQMVGRMEAMSKALHKTHDAMEGHLKAPKKEDHHLKICLCTLSCEFHVGTQDQLCEVCDCSMEFNAHNVKGALEHMRLEVINRDESIRKLEEAQKDDQEIRR